MEVTAERLVANEERTVIERKSASVADVRIPEDGWWLLYGNQALKSDGSMNVRIETNGVTKGPRREQLRNQAKRHAKRLCDEVASEVETGGAKGPKRHRSENAKKIMSGIAKRIAEGTTRKTKNGIRESKADRIKQAATVTKKIGSHTRIASGLIWNRNGGITMLLQLIRSAERRVPLEGKNHGNACPRNRPRKPRRSFRSRR